MGKVSIIGLDLEKRSFQAYGVLADGGVGFRKHLSPEKVFASMPSSHAASSPWRPAGAPTIGGERYATSGTGFDDPSRLRPFRQAPKDAVDAEAIAEAASRPTTRFLSRSRPRNSRPAPCSADFDGASPRPRRARLIGADEADDTQTRAIALPRMLPRLQNQPAERRSRRPDLAGAFADARRSRRNNKS